MIGRAAGLLARAAPDLLVLGHRVAAMPQTARLWLEPTERVIRRQFRAKRQGAEIDLAAPRGFSEKLNARKLRPATALERRCADKLAVRGYVEKIAGPDILPRLYLSTSSLARVSPRRIAAHSFVLKPNHSWGDAIVCRDRTGFDWMQARRDLAVALAYDNWLRHREPVYRGIRRRVLAEELLHDADGPTLSDYKFLCFGGRPEVIMLVRNDAAGRTKTMFRPDWTRLPATRAGEPALTVTPPPPRDLDRMLTLAERLSAPFDFCRVDLYQTTRGVVFGELTFFPQGGLGRFEPPEWELRLGDMIPDGPPR